MAIYQSGEDYLETILEIQNQKGYVKSVDIVEHMGFAKSSVSKAMKQLEDKGFVVIGDNHKIVLTSLGRERAEIILERHKFVSNMLQCMGVAKDIAERDACEIEHAISNESFEAIKKLYKKVYGEN